MKARPCPFCAMEPRTTAQRRSYTACSNPICTLFEVWMYTEDWNHRPKPKPKKRKTK